jgi:microcompartment protein CcmK/EutM
MTNLVSNTGVVATDTTGVGTARWYLTAAGYGTDKAIFGYGYTSAAVSITNKVSNTGVVATDTIGVGTARYGLAAAGYSLS